MTRATIPAARTFSAAVVIVGLAVSASTARLARAQGRDPVAAEAAFAEARALMQKGRFEEACPKLEASQSLDPALGTLLNLGECYERVGKTASAWLRYREAAAIALEKGQRERETIARGRIAALEPRLCKLAIRVAEQREITVTRDGATVLRAAYGIPVPVDPGRHVIEATGGGEAPFSTEVEVRASRPEGACELTTVEVPVLGTSRPAPAPAVAFQPIVLPPPEAPSPSPSSRWGGLHTLAVVSAGLGVVGLGIGSAFGLSASSTKSDADAGCAPAGCTAGSKALLADAGSAADASTVAFTVGAAFLVAGVVLWVVSPSLR
ncbi:MAG: tetratricopeptide repeat protein [Deltaproteobacteria bacterium]|nr:tetratricopeptide repeat protein [Deltaproteobacteria bacterium]